MIVRHVYSSQYQSISRGRWAPKRFLMFLVSHLGKKLFIPKLLDTMLYELDVQDPQRNDYWTCLKVRWSFGVPASWKSLLDILQVTEKYDWQTANIDVTVFEISFLVEKSAGHYGPVDWTWMSPCYRRTLSHCPGSEMSLSILGFWKLLTMYFLLT